jgi:hypothetical protein
MKYAHQFVFGRYIISSGVYQLNNSWHTPDGRTCPYDPKWNKLNMRAIYADRKIPNNQLINEEVAKWKPVIIKARTGGYAVFMALKNAKDAYYNPHEELVLEGFDIKGFRDGKLLFVSSANPYQYKEGLNEKDFACSLRSYLEYHAFKVTPTMQKVIDEFRMIQKQAHDTYKAFSGTYLKEAQDKVTDYLQDKVSTLPYYNAPEDLLGEEQFVICDTINYGHGVKEYEISNTQLCTLPVYQGEQGPYYIPLGKQVIGRGPTNKYESLIKLRVSHVQVNASISWTTSTGCSVVYSLTTPTSTQLGLSWEALKDALDTFYTTYPLQVHVPLTKNIPMSLISMKAQTIPLYTGQLKETVEESYKD